MIGTDIVRLADRFSRRVHIEVTKRTETSEGEPLGPLGSMVLLSLDGEDAVPLTRVVERVGRDKSQITRTVQVLEENNLLMRTPCRQDRRVLRLSLTEPGRDKVREMRATIDRVLDEVLVSLSEHEREALRNILQKVRL